MKDYELFSAVAWRIQQFRANFAERESVSHDQLHTRLLDNLALIEELHALRTWEAFLQDPTKTVQDLKKFLKDQCVERENNLGTVSSFFAQIKSHCNQLYWDLAMLIEEPKTLTDMLKVLFPSVVKTLKVKIEMVIETYADSEDASTAQELGIATVDSVALSENELEMSALTRLLIVNDTLLDLHEIEGLDFDLLSSFVEVIRTMDPSFELLLRNRNSSLDTALACVDTRLESGSSEELKQAFARIDFNVHGLESTLKMPSRFSAELLRRTEFFTTAERIGVMRFVDPKAYSEWFLESSQKNHDVLIEAMQLFRSGQFTATDQSAFFNAVLQQGAAAVSEDDDNPTTADAVEVVVTRLRIEQFRTRHAKHNVQHQSAVQSTPSRERFVFQRLLAEANLVEEQYVLNEWSAFIGTCHSVDHLKAFFIEKCGERQTSHAHSVLSFFGPLQMTQCNRFYWDLAILIFNPQTLDDLLASLFPDVKQTLNLNITTSPDALLDFDNAVVEPVITPGIALQEEIHGSVVTHKSIDIRHLQRLLIVGDTLFDLDEIQHYDVVMLSKFVGMLERQFPAFHRLLWQRNSAFDVALGDATRLQHRGQSVREAFALLIASLSKDAVDRTGKELEASRAVDVAVGLFYEFLNRLPADRRQSVLRIGHPSTRPFLGQELPLTIDLILNRLTRGIEPENCVAQAKQYSSEILNYPPNARALAETTQMSPQQESALRARHARTSFDLAGVENTTTIPQPFYLQLACKFRIENIVHVEEMLLLALPESYELFLKASFWKVPDSLISWLRGDYIVSAQRFAFFAAVLSTESYSSRDKFFQFMIAATPDTDVLALITRFPELVTEDYPTKNLVFMCMIALIPAAQAAALVTQVPELTRVARAMFAATDESPVAKRVEQKLKLLPFLSADDRGECVTHVFAMGERTTTLIDYLLNEASEAVLSTNWNLFTDEQRLALLKSHVPRGDRSFTMLRICNHAEAQWLVEQPSQDNPKLSVFVHAAVTRIGAQLVLDSLTPAQYRELLRKNSEVYFEVFERALVADVFTADEALRVVHSHIARYRVAFRSDNFFVGRWTAIFLAMLSEEQAIAFLETRMSSLGNVTVRDQLAQAGEAVWHDFATTSSLNSLMQKHLRGLKPLTPVFVCARDLMITYRLPDAEREDVFKRAALPPEKLAKLLAGGKIQWSIGPIDFHQANPALFLQQVGQVATVSRRDAFMLIRTALVNIEALQKTTWFKQVLNDVDCLDQLIATSLQAAWDYFDRHSSSERQHLLSRSQQLRITSFQCYRRLSLLVRPEKDDPNQKMLNVLFSRVRLELAATQQVDDMPSAKSGDDRPIRLAIQANLSHLTQCPPGTSAEKCLRTALARAIAADDLPSFQHYFFYLGSNSTLEATDILTQTENIFSRHYQGGSEVGEPVLMHALACDNSCLNYLLSQTVLPITPTNLLDCYIRDPIRGAAARRILSEKIRGGLSEMAFRLKPQISYEVIRDIQSVSSIAMNSFEDYFQPDPVACVLVNAHKSTRTDQIALIDAIYPIFGMQRYLQNGFPTVSAEKLEDKYKKFTTSGASSRSNAIAVFENLARSWRATSVLRTVSELPRFEVEQAILIVRELKACTDSELYSVFVKAFIRASFAKSKLNDPSVDDSFLQRLFYCLSLERHFQIQSLADALTEQELYTFQKGLGIAVPDVASMVTNTMASSHQLPAPASRAAANSQDDDNDEIYQNPPSAAGVNF